MENVKKKEALTDPRKYVRAWFAVKGLTARDGLIREGVLNSIILDYENTPKKKGWPRISQTLIKLAFEEYLTDNLSLALTNIGQKFANKPANLEPLKAWVRAVTGNEKFLDIEVMRHWLWSVKRKALGLPVTHHIMPVLYGPQGNGKSTAVRMLIEPLKEFELSMPLHELSDSRHYKAMSYNLIYFSDEMQGITKTDITALKNQITSPCNSFRPFYTQTSVRVPQSCSFIGCTNVNLNELIFDATGMRRFYEINVPGDTDREALATIDYTALWEGIDETSIHAPLGNQETNKLLVQTQDSMVNLDDVTLFIRDFELKGGTDSVPRSELYRMFCTWQADQGSRFTLSAHSFYNKMANRGILSSKVNKTVYFFVNASQLKTLRMVK